MRDVEMVCEQHHQLADLVDKLHTQNNQLRLLNVSSHSTGGHDYDDDDQLLLSADDSALMMAASLGEFSQIYYSSLEVAS